MILGEKPLILMVVLSHHGEPGHDILLESITEHVPCAALNGALGEVHLGELVDAGCGGDLDLVAFVLKVILDQPTRSFFRKSL
jgi:hypothetical protein